MNIIFVVVFTTASFFLGKYFGSNEKEQEMFLKNPDYDMEGSKEGNLQLLLFTKSERYDLGRAMVLGTKKDIKIAKNKLEKAIINIKSISADVQAEKHKANN